MTRAIEDLIPDYLRGLPVYVPGKPIEEVERELKIHAVKLASNENPLGPSPKGIAADRKSTRLNSSHSQISYAVFCLKTKKSINIIGSRDGSRNRRRLISNQTGKTVTVCIKRNISTIRNKLLTAGESCIHLNPIKNTP